MRQLTQDEEKLLERYVKISRVHDRFALFKHGRESSNELLNRAELLYRSEEPTDYDLTYLQGIAARKSRNYRKLRGMARVLRVTAALKDATLTELQPGDD